MAEVPPIEVSPAQVVLKGPFNKKTESFHEIKNTSDAHRIVIKVKTSDNSLFRVRPVFEFIDPGKTVQLQIHCNELEVTADKKPNHRFVVLYAIAPADCKDAPGFWKACDRWKEFKMAVNFELEGEAKKPDEPAAGGEEKKPEEGGEKKEGEEAPKDAEEKPKEEAKEEPKKED